MSMNVSLTPELEELVRSKVAAGQYASASEVVREALRLLAERDEQLRARLAQLRSEVMAGVAQLDDGHSGPLDIEKLKALARQRLLQVTNG